MYIVKYTTAKYHVEQSYSTKTRSRKIYASGVVEQLIAVFVYKVINQRRGGDYKHPSAVSHSFEINPYTVTKVALS